MYIGYHAERTPDRLAVIMAETGESLTYREVNDNSNRVAQYFKAKGLKHGDAVAILLENHINYMDMLWACLRSGLYVVPINCHGTEDEIAFVLNDSGAKVFVSSSQMHSKALAAKEKATVCEHWLYLGSAPEGWMAYSALLESYADTPLDVERMGSYMPYTSGTTGRPKGVERPLPPFPASQLWDRAKQLADAFDLAEGMVYYGPAPMYHAAPLLFLRSAHCLGGTIVQVSKFDEKRALEHIEQYQVTHTQMVPTMFVRMLKLPEADRKKYKLDSLQSVVHIAAPCPVEVKHAMIEWLGPIIHEYYGASDGAFIVPIRCQDWLEHPGSVGKASPGSMVVCGEDGEVLPPGETGLVYFVYEGEPHTYRNDPEKTRETRHPLHDNWTTCGDIGHLDEEGFLYLSDRKAFMIISGGVNIYPQMVENALIGHAAVRDVAVFGIPNAEMGEEVKAVVELQSGYNASDGLADQLMAYAKENVAAYMRPRSIDFVASLPRTQTGKLLKKQLRDEYWSNQTA